MVSACSSKEENPVRAYYKNIPAIRGWTKDEKPLVLTIEINVAYRRGNNKLQTELNRLKPQLTEALRKYFTNLKAADFLVENEAVLKAGAIEALNEVVLNSRSPEDADKIRRMEDPEDRDLVLDIKILTLQLYESY